LGITSSNTKSSSRCFDDDITSSSTIKTAQKIIGYDIDDMVESESYYERISTDNYFLDEELKTHLNFAENWMKYKNWYRDRGIPWKAGICFEGPPGTGKSKFANLIASQLKIPLEIMSLSTYRNAEFRKDWSNSISENSGCVVLLEDFHTIFNGRDSLNKNADALQFGTLLDVISGAGDSCGVFLVITTNDINTLDWALGGPHGRIDSDDMGEVTSRPGRIDKIITIGPASYEIRKMMIERYLKDLLTDDEMVKLIEETDGATAAQVQYICIEKAYDVMNK
jgi:SpoVK/Ycf46/Vps4 family AAA+-type ATPase